MAAGLGQENSFWTLFTAWRVGGGLLLKFTEVDYTKRQHFP